MIDLDPKIAKTLDQHTRHVHEQGDWEQVLLDASTTRRWAVSTRRRRILIAAFATLAVAALVAVVPALAGKGYFWLGEHPTFPHTGIAAQKRTVAIFHLRHHSPVVVTASPSKPGTLDGPGICYLFSGLTSGCSTRSPHGAVFGWPGPSNDIFNGYTFETRVTAATVVYPNGTMVNVPVVRAPAPISAAFFVAEVPLNPKALLLKGSNGQIISRIPYPHLPKKHP